MKWSRTEWSWAFYDWANSVYALLVMTAFFPFILSHHVEVADGGQSPTVMLGFANSAASLVVVILAPLVGALGDQYGARRKLLAAFAVLGILSTFCLGLVGDGESIALDASTTAWQIARHLKERKELTVVTNGLFIALEFVESPGVTVVMPGGSLRTASASLVGDQGGCILERYHVQKGFFGAGGFTLEEGLTDTDQYEVELKRRMVERAKDVIAVVDSSKWGQVTFAPLVPVDRLQRVITDGGAPPSMVAALRQRGIAVTQV